MSFQRRLESSCRPLDPGLRQDDTTVNSKLKHFSLLFLFALLIFYPTLQHLYLDIDEVLWAEFAHAVLNGCPPYVCVIGEKPPLLYLTYAGIFKIFGTNNYFALHLFHIVWIACTAFLLNLLPLSLEGKCASIFGQKEGDLGFTFFPGLFYILLFALPEFRTLAATGESFMNLFLVASFYLFLKNKNWILIGVLVGLASLYRHQAAIQLFVYIFVILREMVREPHHVPIGIRRNMVSLSNPCICLFFGFFFTWALMSLILYLWGAWPAFWEWGILHNLGYIQNGAKAPGIWLTALENLGLFFGKTIVFWILLFIPPLRLRGGQGKFTLFLYLSSALLAACTGFRFFPHYFIQTFPPLALLAVLGLKKINFPLWAKTGLTLSLALVLFQNVTLSKTLEEDSTKDYASLNKTVGDYIQQHTNIEDKIVVWGWGQGIYAYANRRMGTRYIASDFLTGRIPASDAKQYPSMEAAQKFVDPKAWEYFFGDLEKNKPLYFIDTSKANMHDYQWFPPEAYARLKDYVDQNYFLEKTLEQIKIYHRK
ncbi:MAG: hypothetical protein HQM15_03840 [Deltaproteobacteria bacterium]|nr:hypothetical protein [Deltaproteobacteria bacterium]